MVVGLSFEAKQRTQQTRRCGREMSDDVLLPDERDLVEFVEFECVDLAEDVREALEFRAKAAQEQRERHEERMQDAVDILVDALYSLEGEAGELEEREEVDDHLQLVIDGLRHNARAVQEWLNEHYYEDPIEVVEGE